MKSEKTETKFLTKTTPKIFKDAVYYVNEKKKSVTCMITSLGERIYGVAKCSDDDVFDVQKGKEIASYRAEIAQRKRDLRNTEMVIRELQQIISNNEYHVKLGLKNRSEISRHWEHFLITALDEKKKQQQNIEFCKKSIEELVGKR